MRSPAVAAAKVKRLLSSGWLASAFRPLLLRTIRVVGLVPIHGVNWDPAKEEFSNIVRLQDGEALQL